MGSKRVHLNVFEKGPVSDSPKANASRYRTRKKPKLFIEEYQDEYLFMLNHPDWSLLEYQDIEAYDQFFALEVMNWGTEYYDGIGEGSHWGNCILVMDEGGVRSQPTTTTTDTRMNRVTVRQYR